MYCKNCGKQIDDKAVICVYCGCLTDEGEKLNFDLSQNKLNNKTNTNVDNSNKTLASIAKVLVIITTVFTGFYIIPLFWTVPMTQKLSRALNNNEKISIGFKICILLFLNTIAGILLLCMKNEEQNQ